MSDDPLRPIRALTGVYPGMNRPGRLRRRVRGFSHLPSNCFHVMSRTCGGQVFFDDTEKEALTLLLKRLAAFCGLKLLTYCVMGNHFHALVRVPQRLPWLRERFEGPGGEQRLLRHLRLLYSKAFVQAFAEDLRQLRAQGQGALAEARVAAMKARMGDLSVWVREVKRRFSRWYNRRHGRRGTLWMGPFQSVLVEGRGGAGGRGKGEMDALQVMAAYIDLNPVRAGLVREAGEYRWSGWGAAQAGEREAQAGLCEVAGCGEREWEGRGRTAYAGWVRGHKPAMTGDSPAGAPSIAGTPESPLLKSMRALSCGVALGRRDFVEEVFAQWRSLFGPARQRGARPLDTASAAGHLMALRDLRRR